MKPPVDDPPIFLKVPRQPAAYRSIEERLRDYRDVAVPRSEAQSRAQASRCLACFLPFCHWSCPLGNHVPDWNQAVAEGQWERAYRRLQETNNFPEVTARICPAMCEAACVLNLSGGEPVTIREDELAVIERAFQSGLVVPEPPSRRTGKSVAVIGSGPAGLACADQLNSVGHRVVVFERDEKPGGILRYGIPDFKLEKWVLDRRLKLLEAEGIEFVTHTAVGKDYPAASLRKAFDAVCVAVGCRVPRDLPIEGRGLNGIHFAMDFLTQSNRRVAGEDVAAPQLIDAKDKRVVVLGGGDTGADCVGTANRQGATSVTQLEILAKPPETRRPRDLWPDWPNILRTSSSHEEGVRREWGAQTRRFLGRDERVTGLECVRVEWVHPAPSRTDVDRPIKVRTADAHWSVTKLSTVSCAGGGVKAEGAGRPSPKEIPETAFTVEADLVLLAMGFVGPQRHPLIEALGLRADARGTLETDADAQTSVPGIFAAGDARRGQSLVVWAIAEGRRAARAIDAYLTGRSDLPVL